MIRLTARDALAGSRNAAVALATKGVKPGDRIAICVTPSTTASAELVQALVIQTAWAAVRSHITPVMINPALPNREQDSLIADCEPSLTIRTTAQLRDLVAPGITGTSHDTGTFTARPMHYTSGTTGRAKGVWTGFLSPESLAQWWTDEQAQWVFDSHDSTLVHGPLSSSAPLRHSLLVLAAGGDVLLPGAFEPTVIARALAQDKPTSAFTVPSHWQRLFSLPELPSSPYRLLAHAGSQCPPALKQTIHSWAGADRTWEFYGSTEGQFTACVGSEWEHRPGTLGRARSGRRIFTEGPTIWCQTPQYSRFEYWQDPAKSAAAWQDLPGGEIAFTVGDLGRIDDQGYLFLDGRREDLIISGGMNVYPAQVEAALATIPGVVDSAVFGIPDERWGQLVCAAIVGNVTDEQIGFGTAQQLAGYQRPKQIFRTTELPRNAMGKVQRLNLPAHLGIDSSD